MKYAPEMWGWTNPHRSGPTLFQAFLSMSFVPQTDPRTLFFSAPCQTGSFPGGTSVKEPTCQCRWCKRCGFNPWAGKIPWRRAQQPTPVFLPGEFHGQRSLVGYSALGRKSRTPLKWLSTYSCMSNRSCTLGQPGKGECWVCFSCQMFLLHAADFPFVMFFEGYFISLFAF